MPDKLYIIPTTTITSLTDLINNLFMDSDGDRVIKAVPTYEDEACTEIDCFSARRSFEDMLTLARTYFPDTTELELMDTLVKLAIQFIYCPDIRKLVFVGRVGSTIHPDNFKRVLGHYSLTEGTYTADSLSDIYNQI